MKRSEVNRIIERTKEFFAEHRFALPPWAFWGPRDWQGKGRECAEIVNNMLGWDITDFGSGEFERRGLTLFTLRNGRAGDETGKTYAEKIMVAEEEQETPLHFHWFKMEDIINRGGGNLVVELYNSTPDEDLADTPVRVKTDGVERTVEAGGKVILKPGESICLEPGMYHRFYGEKGKGPVLIGEVSRVNDDNKDNRFHAPIGRFPALEEDEEPVHLLVTDYAKYVTA